MEQVADLFVFRRFLSDADSAFVSRCHRAALDKLNTLYPGKRITTYDELTLGIETDSMYSDTGIDTYELGLVDNEIPALRNTRSDDVITFRVD